MILMGSMGPSGLEEGTRGGRWTPGRPRGTPGAGLGYPAVADGVVVDNQAQVNSR